MALVRVARDTKQANNPAPDTGANASAEGGEEELDDGEEKVNDVLDAGRLSSTSFGKKDYLTYLKGWYLSGSPEAIY